MIINELELLQDIKETLEMYGEGLSPEDAQQLAEDNIESILDVMFEAETEYIHELLQGTINDNY